MPINSIVHFSGFNSRTREGATDLEHLDELLQSVSIHAPVRVRRRNSSSVFWKSSFNSRTREGATTMIPLEVLDKCFNSRTREGATI